MTVSDLFKYKVFTVSNFLSFSRAILVFPVAWYFYTESYPGENDLVIISLVAVMILTDYFDGFLARKLGQMTPLGQYLDPVSDKIAILSLLYMLVLKRDYPWQMFFLICFREVLGVITGLFLLTKRNVLGKPNYWGKTGVFFISLSGIAYMFRWEFSMYTNGPVLFVLSGGILAYALKYKKTILRN